MRSLVIFFVITFSALTVQAFPEMIRLNYANCTACHVSPSGGGLLTDYGRSISAEALSKWAKPKEELVGHGYLPEPPAWLKLGGDVRLIQIYVDNPQATATSFFPMQVDFEYGLNFEKFWWVQSLGVQGGRSDSTGQGQIVSHHVYALYNWTDEVYTRAGKYYLPYGIYIPDHTSYIKRNLNMDQGQETYNAEIGRVGEVWGGMFTVSLGRRDNYNVDLEKGVSTQVSYNLGDNKKIMGSLAYLKKEGASTRYLLGPQVLWSFNERLVFLGEYDYQEKTLEATQSVQKGVVTYSRLQYEWIKGFHSYLLHQLSYLDFTQLNTRINGSGIGMLFYPRPHFELSAELNYSETAEVNTYNTMTWLLGHYYF